MKATEIEKQIIEDRASELEKIGFKFNCNASSVWYEKGEVKMPATLMMCAPTKDWNEFILKHTDKPADESPIKEDEEDDDSQLYAEEFNVMQDRILRDEGMSSFTVLRANNEVFAELKSKFHITRKQ